MNKSIIATVLACGLLLLDSPEAAAHDQRHNSHRGSVHGYSDHYRGDASIRHRHARDRYRQYYRHNYRGNSHRRAHRMPYWLKRDRAFRHWYEHTRLRRNLYLSWQILFDIYRWEHSGRHYHRH